jgi:hypothetical protein
MQFVLFLAAMLGPSDMTAQDLHAQFLENALRMRTLRVRWSAQSDLTSVGRAADDARIAALTEFLKGGVTAEVHDRLTRELKMLRETNRKNRPAVYRVGDYWSDRRHFQVRAPYNQKTGGTAFAGKALKIQFPNEEANAAGLASALRDFEVLSYGPATKNLLRVWQGDGENLAAVKSPKSRMDAWVPPLALPDANLGWVPHPIDEFVQQYLFQAGARVVGEFVLEGHSTILVECIQDKRSARAFLDPVSAVPRRIEFFLGSIERWRGLVGRNTDHPRPIAARIVRDVEFTELMTAGIQVTYPVRCVVQRLSEANSPQDAVSKAQPDIAVHEVTTWSVQDVAFNVPMSESNFALEFPPGTTFRNEPTNELLVVGDASGRIERLVRGASRPTTDDSATRGRWIWLSVGVSVVIVACFIVFWRQRRTR